MLATAPPSTFAPFRIRAFRFQWPADLATSWAFEMETLILGWYVLVATQSVLLLTFFVSLQHLGTLIAPMFGVMGDRLGHRNVLTAMRGFYALLATTLMTFTFLGVLTPVHVFLLAGSMGLVRPSDVGMRAAVVADTMPRTLIVGAMGVQRTTMDSAKIAGALTGAGLVTALGMGPAYLAVAIFYVASVLLTLKAGAARRADSAAAIETPQVRASPWRDLREGVAYVWTTPHLLAAIFLAFLLNLTVFPLFNGLLPYVAKEIYETDQRGLGWMVAGAASGALVGSIMTSRHGRAFRAGRVMVAGSLGWLTLMLVFAHISHHFMGIAVLFLAGLVQSMSQVPMNAMLLRTANEQYRGRVMGLRMLAIYGNIPGLLIAGQLIPRIGYPLTASLYCLVGVVFTAVITLRWRGSVWRLEGAANVR
jgi:predicted MFS family arabinose efflux permease